MFVVDYVGIIIVEQVDIGQNVLVGQLVYQFVWLGDVDVVSDVFEVVFVLFVFGYMVSVMLLLLLGCQFVVKVCEIVLVVDL